MYSCTPENDATYLYAQGMTEYARKNGISESALYLASIELDKRNDVYNTGALIKRAKEIDEERTKPTIDVKQSNKKKRGFWKSLF